MVYVDAFVLPVSKKNLKAYRNMARQGGKMWMKYGALEYFECVGDDLKGMPIALSFPKGIRTKKGETVVFSWILFKSKKHRNAVNAKVMKDPQLNEHMDKKMPFEVKRTLYGGFKPIVSLYK
ncbi:MAG TPA: DUF1428 domain-containing protein [archaeon]|nr:DUF1428 domain-containing protein [archaeon]